MGESNVKFYVILILATSLISSCKLNEEKVIREPLFAGSFYPDDPTVLNETVSTFLDRAPYLRIDNIKAVVVPHAGYIYSGQVAAQSFKQLDSNYKKVFIIANNHNSEAIFNGISIPNATHYKTPLGEVKLSKIKNELLENELFVSVPKAHTMQMIEVEIPFLQKILKDFEIIPIILGRLSDSDISMIADILANYSNNTLFVFSIDLSHYYTYDEALQLDSYCINSMLQQDYEAVKRCTTDGNNIFLILLKLAEKYGWNIRLLDYKNSGDTAGTKDRVVGYASMIATDDMLSKEEQAVLMKLARDTIEQYVKTGTKLEPDMDIIQKYPKLMKEKAAFVSLDKLGRLRGSIGSLLPHESLYLSIRNHAINTVSTDIRFKPVEPEELDSILITISVLELPYLIQVNNYTDYLRVLRPFKDGVIIVKNGNQATYLPQVWKQIPDKEDFLSNLCLKATLEADCWKDPETQVYRFRAQVFYERDFS